MTHAELRGIIARKLMRALEADGFLLRRIHGSHHVFAHRDGRIVTVTAHAPGDSFPPGTLRSILAGDGVDTRRLRTARAHAAGATGNPSVTGGFSYTSPLPFLEDLAGKGRGKAGPKPYQEYPVAVSHSFTRSTRTSDVSLELLEGERAGVVERSRRRETGEKLPKPGT